MGQNPLVLAYNFKGGTPVFFFSSEKGQKPTDSEIMEIYGHEPRISWPTQIQKNVFFGRFFVFFLQKFVDINNHIILTIYDIIPVKCIRISKGYPLNFFF